MANIMTEKQLGEIFQLQQDYDNGRILFQEFKDKFIVKLVAYSSVKDIENICSFILKTNLG